MRTLWAALLAAAVVAQPAAAANGNPRAYVLAATDVPGRYLMDKDNSFLVSKAALSSSPNQQALARVLERAGFRTGYYARYLNTDPPRWRYIGSAAYLFRTSQGARTFFAWVDKQFATAGVVRRPVHLGDAATGYASTSRETGTRIAWRYGRVVAWVWCQQMTDHWKLAASLAPKQQRRIVAALG